MDAHSLFEAIIRNENDIKGLREENKAMVDSFASSNNMTSKGILKGLKEYRAWKKDQAQFRVEEADACKLFESLAHGTN